MTFFRWQQKLPTLAQKEISKEFENKGALPGTRDGEVRETQFLGRTTPVTDQGYQYEANVKHVQMLMQEWNIEGCRSLSCPATEKPNPVDKEDGQEILSLAAAKVHRRAAARINYGQGPLVRVQRGFQRHAQAYAWLCSQVAKNPETPEGNSPDSR